MPNARNNNCARLQSVCAASGSKRTGGHSAFVSRNQTYALAFLALIGPYGRFPPMRYHSRDINRRRTIKSPRTPVSRPRSPLMGKSELLVPRYLASRFAYCGRPIPPVRSGLSRGYYTLSTGFRTALLGQYDGRSDLCTPLAHAHTCPAPDTCRICCPAVLPP